MPSVLDTVLNRVAQYAEEHPRSRVAQRGVQRCKEFERVDALPRRHWDNGEVYELVQALTAILRVPNGAQTLRPIQAIALYEIAEMRGAIGTIRVGAGKTLVSFLAPRVLGCNRPLLIIPAKLKRKTKRELVLCAAHWRIAGNLSIISYEWLGRVQAVEYLNRLAPDCIILDEAHKIRNLKAAVTRRLNRYCTTKGPATIAMSGTLVRSKLLDWAHIGNWALGEGSPAPRKWNTIAHWGNSLDLEAKLPPGALSKWDTGHGHRSGYQQRVNDTPGVVATIDGLLGVALEIEAFEVAVPREIQEALKDLDDWILPDGFIITDPLAHARAERQLALGCYYRWVEPPPLLWAAKRSDWSRFVRHAVRYLKPNGNPLDSELHVAQHCANGALDDRAYKAWKEIKPSFKPVIEHVWMSDEIVQALIGRAKKNSAIVWIESVAVGERMHSLGLRYCGRQGLTADGEYIEDMRGPICASIASNSEGRNLQFQWSHAIVSCPMKDAVVWEQMIGRIHREGQTKDEVSIDVLFTCENHRRAWKRALIHAAYLETINGQPQKLLQATIIEGTEANE